QEIGAVVGIVAEVQRRIATADLQPDIEGGDAPPLRVVGHADGAILAAEVAVGFGIAVFAPVPRSFLDERKTMRVMILDEAEVSFDAVDVELSVDAVVVERGAIRERDVETIAGAVAVNLERPRLDRQHAD